MAGAGTTSARDDHLNELAISISRRFERLSLPSNCCIFTVSKRLRQTNKKAYTPLVVAIGPYHHRNPSLKPMEDHKLLYLENFLQHDQKNRLEDYIDKVKSWEDEARNCYDRQINLNSDKFTEMILFDGIFVIQLLLMSGKQRKRLPNDQIFGERWIVDDVRRDMILLENQIPFFVIRRLFKMAFEEHQGMPALLELVCQFFQTVQGMEKLPKSVESEVKHFVHAINLSFLLSVRKAPDQRNKKIKFTPSATELVAAGVKLRRSDSKCLFDIKFENGVLDIPYLVLEDWTEFYFRNIVAFEECSDEKAYMIDYMAFMHHLVDTPGDAKLLIDKGIIENWLSNKEAAARVINNLGKEYLLPLDFYFNDLSHELANHCQRPYNKWKATFKHDYCSNPWVVISVIAAVLLLLLTVVQAVCSVLSLKNPAI